MDLLHDLMLVLRDRLYLFAKFHMLLPEGVEVHGPCRAVQLQATFSELVDANQAIPILVQAGKERPCIACTDLYGILGSPVTIL